MGDDITFHSKRAMAELDLAVRASSTPAARAHFGLSALHLERMKTLVGGAPTARAEVSDAMTGAFPAA